MTNAPEHSVDDDASEERFVESQQIEAYFREANDQNLTGALVWSLMVFFLQPAPPQWTWLPGLLALYAITVARAWHVRQFGHRRQHYDTAYWQNTQTLLAGGAGVCWGVTSVCMLPYLPVTESLLLITLIGVSVVVAASEGSTFIPPSRAFSIRTFARTSQRTCISGPDSLRLPQPRVGGGSSDKRGHRAGPVRSRQGCYGLAAQ